MLLELFFLPYLLSPSVTKCCAAGVNQWQTASNGPNQQIHWKTDTCAFSKKKIHLYNLKSLPGRRTNRVHLSKQTCGVLIWSNPSQPIQTAMFWKVAGGTHQTLGTFWGIALIRLLFILLVGVCFAWGWWLQRCLLSVFRFKLHPSLFF